MLQVSVDWLVYSLLGLSRESKLAGALDFFLYDSVKITLLLFVMIAAIPMRIHRKATFFSMTENGWALDFILLLISFSSLILGPGIFSLDYIIFKL